MDRIYSIFQSIDKVDVADIFVVSVIFYLVFFLLKESRSFTALRGLVALIFSGMLIWIIAKAFTLTATTRLLENSLLPIVIVFIILFSNELKRALTDFGQTSIFRPFLQTNRFEIDEIIKAVTRMSEKRVGALIAIERRNTLRPYVEVGTPIDSRVSAELIRTIFQVGTPLHDGALIIRNNRVAAAGCLLPLSENPRLSKDFGTRHRAGIGLTEETDAVTIVCSEETGNISVAHEGKLERSESAEALRVKLKALFDFEEEDDA